MKVQGNESKHSDRLLSSQTQERSASPDVSLLLSNKWLPGLSIFHHKATMPWHRKGKIW